MATMISSGRAVRDNLAGTSPSVSRSPDGWSRLPSSSSEGDLDLSREGSATPTLNARGAGTLSLASGRCVETLVHEDFILDNIDNRPQVAEVRGDGFGFAIAAIHDGGRRYEGDAQGLALQVKNGSVEAYVRWRKAQRLSWLTLKNCCFNFPTITRILIQVSTEARIRATQQNFPIESFMRVEIGLTFSRQSHQPLLNLLVVE